MTENKRRKVVKLTDLVTMKNIMFQIQWIILFINDKHNIQ